MSTPTFSPSHEDMRTQLRQLTRQLKLLTRKVLENQIKHLELSKSVNELKLANVQLQRNHLRLVKSSLETDRKLDRTNERTAELQMMRQKKELDHLQTTPSQTLPSTNFSERLINEAVDKLEMELDRKLSNKIHQLHPLYHIQQVKLDLLENKVVTLEQTLHKELQKVTAFTDQLNDAKKEVMNFFTNLKKFQNEIYKPNKKLNLLDKISFADERLFKFTKFDKMSKIVTSPQEVSTIESFFTQNRRPKSAKLLYRASQHEFSTDIFHVKCDNIPNTLVLCTTEFDKKVGGFTPLEWKGQVDKKQVKDNKKESFIFSLTHGDKFILKENQPAIKRDRNTGPIFGNEDLEITQKAHKFYCRAMINAAYHNNNYKKEEQASWQRFFGSHDGYTFKLKEWQVFQINFE